MYVVVKDFNKQWCLCHLVRNPDLTLEIPSVLENSIDPCRIQIVCIGDPSLYGEYAPYKFIDNLGDFIKEALSM